MRGAIGGWLLVVGCWWLAGCVPMQTAAPVINEDAAGFVVAGDVYESDLFSLRIPEGWRVVTGERGAPPALLLVAPDDCALIAVSSTPLDAAPVSPSCDTDDLRSDLQTVRQGEAVLYMGGSAPADEWATFMTALEQVVSSLMHEAH